MQRENKAVARRDFMFRIGWLQSSEPHPIRRSAARGSRADLVVSQSTNYRRERSRRRSDVAETRSRAPSKAKTELAETQAHPVHG